MPYDEYRILFGKTYRGYEWTDPCVAESWLEWVSENYDYWRVRDRAWRELIRRREERESRQHGQSVGSHIDHEVLAEVVREGRRSAALKYHPDRPNGNLDRMQKINAVCDQVLDELKK